MVKKKARKVVLKDAQGGYLVPVIDPADKGGTGLELCDIGMALYVDETKGLRRYLNGQIVDINTNTQAFLNRLQEITTLHPSLLCTENEWQTAKTMSAFGQVGKFVFNYSGENIVSVRIPRVVNVQGLFDLQNLGMTVSESLPNITGKAISVDRPGFSVSDLIPYDSSGVLLGYPRTTLSEAQSELRVGVFSASNVNSTYQDGAHVQQEAIQYPYFIQIATGSETENNIVNDIELNNPYSLFDCKYSDHELNNLSWLKSEGQWNAKAVYTDAYDKLLKVYNGTETVEGLSVKLSTETYTDYDFVLNTADETFRLPLDTIDHPINSTGTLPVKGNGMTLGFTDGNNNAGLWVTSSQSNLETYDSLYGTNIGTTSPTGKTLNSKSIGLTTDSSKSGIVADLTSKKANLYLYFYVGETVQNANLIDAGRIGEQLANKVNMLQASGAGMPSSKYIDLTLGASGSTYTAPANGWFILQKSSTANAYVYLQNTSKNNYLYGGFETNGIDISVVAPVCKGDVIKAIYTANGSIVGFSFIYAEGEVS